MKNTKNYRPDVDGLRAIAVISVLVFHAFPTVLPGGFSGVDIFFVISGFLITGIILGDLAKERFTFANFYARRIRRIFPALALVLGAVLVFGWLALLPTEFRALGAHATAGAAFAANLLLWRQSGDYFAEASELNPLLHLWSLGVEEQYYLVWPLLLILFRRSPRAMLAMIGVVGAVSFALNVVLVERSPMSAFYLPVSRMWELMIGSALACWQMTREPREAGVRATIASTLGAVLVLLGFIHLEQRGFPGWSALLPTVGTALIIAAGPGAVFNQLLSHRAVVWVGLISYPLYLWHWPLLAYLRIVEGGEPSILARLLALGASVLLAWGTYRLLESRVRHRKTPLVVPALAASVAALAGIGVLAFLQIAPARSASVPGLARVTEAYDDWAFRGNRTIPGNADGRVVFLGDSLMQHWVPRIDRVMRERASPVRTTVIHTRGGCAPIPGIDRHPYGCASFVSQGFNLAREAQTQTVVFSASWAGFRDQTDYFREDDAERVPLDLQSSSTDWVWDGFEAAIGELIRSGKQVVLVLSTPRGEVWDPRAWAVRDGIDVHLEVPTPLTREEVRAVTAWADARLTLIAQRTGAMLVDPIEWLCGPTHCAPADDQGRPVFKDRTHVRATVARERIHQLDQFIRAPLPMVAGTGD